MNTQDFLDIAEKNEVVKTAYEDYGIVLQNQRNLSFFEIYGTLDRLLNSDKISDHNKLYNILLGLQSSDINKLMDKSVYRLIVRHIFEQVNIKFENGNQAIMII